MIYIKFEPTKTNHIVIKASVNGVQGDFLLDTGASVSCIGIKTMAFFGIKSITQGGSMTGASISETVSMSPGNSLQVDVVEIRSMDIMLLDMSAINAAMKHNGIGEIHGIIGADFLIQSKAVIDYRNNLILFV